MIDGLTLVETRHLDRKFDRRTAAIDAQRPVRALRDRNDAMVDLRCERAVYSYFLIAGGFSLLQCRVVQEGKAYGALDLQGAVAFEKNRCRMGIDPMNMGMSRGIRQE